MPLMRWFHLVLIEKACHTKKLCAGSTWPAALSLTLRSSSPSPPSRNQKCPWSSPPPPARRFHQRFDILSPERRGFLPNLAGFSVRSWAERLGVAKNVGQFLAAKTSLSMTTERRC